MYAAKTKRDRSVSGLDPSGAEEVEEERSKSSPLYRSPLIKLPDPDLRIHPPANRMIPNLF